MTKAAISFCRATLAALLVLSARPVFAEEPLQQNADAKFRIVGYLPDYRLATIDASIGRYLTDLVYFSVDPDPSGKLDTSRLKPADLALLQRIKRQYKVALLLCVGGWERSGGFARLAAAPQSRARFAAALVRFCRENHFDGVDIDWEHPASEAERRDYAALLRDLQGAFRADALRLTVAAAGWQVISAEAFAAADAIHLMAYDAEGRHSTFEFAESEVDRLVKLGIAPEKICLGVPFYGRGIKSPATSLTFAEIVKKYNPAAAMDEVNGIYFNGATTIERKTRFVKSRKLQGIMIWELGQDGRGDKSLLQVIHRTASTKASAVP